MKEIRASVPLTELNRYFRNMSDLLEIHAKLVLLLETETALKKHHRAYLHVRERIDQHIKETAPQIKKITEDIAEAMKMNAPESLIEKDGVCEGCPCFNCEGDCLSCAESPCYDGRGESPFADAEDDDFVIISKEKYDLMIEDLLTMAELIDMVSDMRTNDARAIQELGKFFPAYAEYEKNRLSLYREAAKEAEDIMNRWDEELDDDYEPEEFYSD
jgi:hypothetical protein